MPYIDIDDLITKQRNSEIDYEAEMRSGWRGDAMDELEDVPAERSSEVEREKTCQICGKVFIAKKNTARLCSSRCQQLRYSGVTHNGEIMKKLEKFALVYLECNRDIVKATRAMGYDDISDGRRSLARAKGEGLL